MKFTPVEIKGSEKFLVRKIKNITNIIQIFLNYIGLFSKVYFSSALLSNTSSKPLNFFQSQQKSPVEIKGL
jgi:hypothetical protein